MNSRGILVAGAGLMLLGVALGAFGAHAIRGWAGPGQLTIWQTATLYLFLHGLGLIGLGLWMELKGEQRLTRLAAMMLLGGVVVFSGSLYLMVLTGNRMLGAITPLGGVSMLAGWGLWGWSLLRRP